MNGWIIFGFVWLLTNVIAKVLLDSMERIYRNDIDSAVKKLPVKIRDLTNQMVTTRQNKWLIFLLEILKLIAMVFFLPGSITLTIFPFLRRIDHFRTQYRFVRALYSREWMAFALVMLEVFTWKGLLLSILSVLKFGSREERLGER